MKLSEFKKNLTVGSKMTLIDFESDPKSISTQWYKEILGVERLVSNVGSKDFSLEYKGGDYYQSFPKATDFVSTDDNHVEFTHGSTKLKYFVVFKQKS